MLRGTAEEEFCDVIMRFCRWGPKVFCMFVLSCTRLMLSLGKITWIIQYDDETRKVYSGSDGYSREKLPEELMELVEVMAKNVHEVWSQSRLSEGWTYGARRDDEKKTHPCLVPYEELPEIEKDYDRNTAIGTLKLIQALGFDIVKKR